MQVRQILHALAPSVQEAEPATGAGAAGDALALAWSVWREPLLGLAASLEYHAQSVRTSTTT